jgi:hypothetical protein
MRALLFAAAGNPMLLSPGRLFRTATRRWLGLVRTADRIVKVTVRDENFQLVRVIDAERDLAVFCKLWAALVEADPDSWSPKPGQPYYKLGIQSIQRGVRTANAEWFYFPGGYIQLLAIWRAIWVAPLYRMPSPDAFEALLRGNPSSLQP